MKKLLLKTDLSTPSARKQMAEDLSLLISCQREFQPYCPNPHDDYFWTIDAGNDWKVKFLPGEWNCFEISYRYDAAGRNPHEVALVGWLAVRLHAELVQSDGTTVGHDDWLKLVAALNSTP